MCKYTNFHDNVGINEKVCLCVLGYLGVGKCKKGKNIYNN